MPLFAAAVARPRGHSPCDLREGNLVPPRSLVVITLLGDCRAGTLPWS